MKRIHHLLLCLIVSISVLLSSCDKEFEQINTSPDLVLQPNIDYTLPYIELTLLDGTYYTNFSFLGIFMYQVDSYGVRQFEGMTTPGGGNYHFDFAYNNSLKNIVDFLEKTKDPILINYHCIARILKAYEFHTVTDLYGDIPYSEAGKGYLDQNFNPEYDAQESIYADMLNELQDASNKFDPSQKLPTKSDIVYGGDIKKWKKFANSLMLRLALRTWKVDPDNSKKWVNTAIQGGLMESNADNFVVYYKPNTYYATISNGQPTPFIFYPTWKLAEPFVAFLRDNNDPRLQAYSVLPNKDTTSNKQLGVPSFNPDYAKLLPIAAYSVSNPATFGKYDAPFMHLSYAQVQLMLAELVVRGWITGNAKTYYDTGVTAAMKEMAVYGNPGIIEDSKIQTYLVRHPFTFANNDEALNLINTQYWVETHYNWFETFSNWRRCGYPKLDESRFKLPRRLTYPSSEVNINSQNVKQVIDRQGPDLVTTRVWWDK